jgi:hypothetical protein
MLFTFTAITDFYRMADVLDADLVDRDLSTVM